MTEILFQSLVPYFLGVVGLLVGIVWKNLNDKIKQIEKSVCDFPTTQLQIDMADMKNDLKWIKRILEKEKQ